MLKITGLDKLQKELKTVQLALGELEGDLGTAHFDPLGPASIESTIQGISRIATDNLGTFKPLIILVFIFCRRHLIARTMPTLTVMKHLDVIKNTAAGFLPRSVDLFPYPFVFRQLGKTFCNHIIVTVTVTVYAPLQTV